jgi:tetratricopeptide (TPR) repeat protein
MKTHFNIKHKNQPDDLDYLSSLAFENFGLDKTEINFLKNKIDLKAHSSSMPYRAIFVSISIGLFIGISIFFVIFQKQKNHPSVANFNAGIESPKASNEHIIKPDSILTQAKLEVIPKLEEHFTSSKKNQADFKEMESSEVLQTKNLIFNVVTPADEKDIILEFIPNAPVIFIQNLKVTNYRSYYFKHNESISLLVNNGLSAQYENNSKIEKSILSKSNSYLAHKIIQNSMRLFAVKKTQSCIDELNLLYEFNVKDANAQFYLGMCYYQLGKYKFAINFFNQNLDNENNIFHQESEFYQALSYLNTNDSDKGIYILNSIIKNKGFYNKRAQEILLNLENK